jgi:hypothetical protein
MIAAATRIAVAGAAIGLVSEALRKMVWRSIGSQPPTAFMPIPGNASALRRFVDPCVNAGHVDIIHPRLLCVLALHHRSVEARAVGTGVAVPSNDFNDIEFLHGTGLFTLDV